VALLEINNLNHYFGGLHAVCDVGFSVKKGMIKAVIGPNGAGKTTLFNLICGNISPHSGSIIFKKKSIFSLKPFQIAACGLSRTFQNIRLFPGMTTIDNVLIGLHTRSKAGFIAGMLNLPWTWREEKETRARAMELLELLDIADLADTDVSNLSFGQQRSVELARALAVEPDIILLDEPAAGLNIYETGELAALIGRVRDKGVTVLLVEHDMSLVMDISDEIVVLSYGQVIAEDIPSNIQKNKEVIKIYLGEEDA